MVEALIRNVNFFFTIKRDNLAINFEIRPSDRQTN